MPPMLTRALAVLLSLAMVSASAAGERVLRLATTTSTDNSGLLGVLVPPFEARYGVRVDVIAVGTGKALRLGANGDVDVVLVHARPAEDAFVAAGNGVNRRDVMYNDFVIVGPSTDPAGVRGMRNAPAALARIAASESVFVSRGDDSGTHKKERRLWQAAGMQPAGAWYREAGQGMGRVLLMASELGAYTLADRGTWLALKDKLEARVLVEGDERLYNPYGIIAVNPAKYRDANYLDAMGLIAWMTSVQGQDIIRDFRKGGEALFIPLAVPGR
jgi:tungstate transport system substrate-binding protein